MLSPSYDKKHIPMHLSAILYYVTLNPLCQTLRSNPCDYMINEKCTRITSERHSPWALQGVWSNLIMKLPMSQMQLFILRPERLHFEAPLNIDVYLQEYTATQDCFRTSCSWSTETKLEAYPRELYDPVQEICFEEYRALCMQSRQQEEYGGTSLNAISVDPHESILQTSVIHITLVLTKLRVYTLVDDLVPVYVYSTALADEEEEEIASSIQAHVHISSSPSVNVGDGIGNFLCSSPSATQPSPGGELFGNSVLFSAPRTFVKPDDSEHSPRIGLHFDATLYTIHHLLKEPILQTFFQGTLDVLTNHRPRLTHWLRWRSDQYLSLTSHSCVQVHFHLLANTTIQKITWIYWRDAKIYQTLPYWLFRLCTTCFETALKIILCFEIALRTILVPLSLPHL